MPLGVQALLPFLALVIAAIAVASRPRRNENGWIAVAAAGVAAGITLLQLLRLAPGERVDVPYLTTFPYADLAIRLDALSLAFATMTLTTAALLMLARVYMPGDRRDPWLSWLLTTVAALAVIMAQNLLLTYILLQVLTLAFSGTLNEGAPRRRRLRLAIGVADVGLLLAAASAIQSVGTSAFSGVPSDTFGPAAFLLALTPVLVRVGALAVPASGSLSPVAFEPAIAWAAPAAYLLMRLVALMGGRLPGRPVEVLVFAVGLLLAAATALWVFVDRHSPRWPTILLVSQAALALALLSSSSPILLVASLWLWLQLIPLAGLCAVRIAPAGLASVGRLLALGMLPGSAAFIAVWIAAAGLRASRQTIPLALVGLAVLAMAAAALSRVQPLARGRLDLPAAWSLALLAVAAFPIALLGPLVLPAAATVRVIPGGTVLLGLTGFSVAGIPWPALPATVLLIVVAAALVLRLGRIPLPRPPLRRPRLTPRFGPPPRLAISTRWASRTLWSVFIAVALFAALRP